jgi:hypothetical protein
MELRHSFLVLAQPAAKTLSSMSQTGHTADVDFFMDLFRSK